MGKEARLTICNPLQPKMRSSLALSQSFIFPGGPPGQNIVQGLEDWVKGWLIEAPIVVNPSPYHGIDYAGQIVQGFVGLPMQTPLPHGLPNRFRRFIADCRIETNKESTPAAPWFAFTRLYASHTSHLEIQNGFALFTRFLPLLVDL